MFKFEVVSSENEQTLSARQQAPRDFCCFDR